MGDSSRIDAEPSGEQSSMLEKDKLLELINQNQETLERAPKATVKGMTPLERPPAPVSDRDG